MEKMKMKENIIIRLERENEYHEVENLVRESFWNVYRPGCLEHYVLHQLHNDPAFVSELDFVMTLDGHLIGQNMFMKAVIAADDGRSIPFKLRCNTDRSHGHNRNYRRVCTYGRVSGK